MRYYTAWAPFFVVVEHLLSTGLRHATAVAELLLFIEIIEEIQIEVRGMITYTQLSTTLMFNV